MANQSNNSVWILVVILAVFLQVVFVFADGRPSATQTAIEFSKAYLLLDRDMGKYMCNELSGDADESIVDDFIQARTEAAGDRGFGIGMVRQTIEHLKTETLAQDVESATIHLEGRCRTCIHPVFAYVAKLFRLGQTQPFEETLDLVKENGQWKVCGASCDLFQGV